MLTKGCCKGNNYEQNLSLDFPDEPFFVLSNLDPGYGNTEAHGSFKLLIMGHRTKRISVCWSKM